MNELGYIPYLRPGVLLHTLIAYRYFQMGRPSIGSVFRDFYDPITTKYFFEIGGNVTSIKNLALCGSISTNELLLKHTLFGVYSRALSPAASSVWSDALISGQDRHLSSRILRRYDSFSKIQLITSSFRSCPRCVRDDIDSFGFAQWRVLHHVPPIHCCPEHGCVLLNEGDVGNGYVRKLALPKGTGSMQTDYSRWIGTDGHSNYLNLWSQLFDGKLSVLVSHAWAIYIDRLISEFGNLDQAKLAIESEVQRTWSTDVPKMRLEIGPHIKANFVHAELSHNSEPFRIAQKLVILGAATSLGVYPTKSDEFTQGHLGLSAKLEHEECLSLQERLRRFLHDAALPGVLAPSLLSGKPIYRIAADAGVHRRYIWRAMERIPDNLLIEISSTRSWPRESWVALEISRRREDACGAPTKRGTI